MDTGKLLTAIGAGVSTFLVVAVVVIETLAFEFSTIVGLPVGLLAGVVALGVVWVGYDDAAGWVRRAAGGYAAFGLVVIGLFALQYVNVGRDVLTVPVMAAAGLVVAVVVFVAFTIRAGGAGRSNSVLD